MRLSHIFLRRFCGVALVATLGAAITGCAGQLPLERLPEHVVATEHQAVDRSRARPARIVMTEYVFAAGEPNFKKGVPYRLELRNTGEVTHLFDARAFFRSIAVRDVQIVETAKIGGLDDPNRAWKPSGEKLADVEPEDEDEEAEEDAEAKPDEDGEKAEGEGKVKGAKDDDALVLEIDDDDEEEADKSAKDDDDFALKIEDDDEDTITVDEEDKAGESNGDGDAEDDNALALKIDDDEDEVDEGAKDDDALALKIDDDEDESEEGAKDDDALALKIDDDEDEPEEGAKEDDDTLALKIDDDEDESEEGAKDDEAESEARRAGDAKMAESGPVLRLPSEGEFDEDDDLTFERTSSESSQLRPVAKEEGESELAAKDEDEGEDDEDDAAEADDDDEDAEDDEDAAKPPPEPWKAITVEYVVVPPGHSAFVSFVPVREGTYWLSSGNPIYLSQGMFERLVIE